MRELILDLSYGSTAKWIGGINMSIEETAYKLQEALTLVEINFVKEVSDNYYYVGRQADDQNIHLRRNSDGKVFVKIENVWKQYIGLLI